ncbi:hypothetical protein Tco_1321412 [Tanacetum coccineum]
MASDDNDQDAEYVLSKLLQMGKVKDYQREFEMLIKRVTISKSLLKSFYIFGLKLDLQCLLLRSKPKTLDEAFSFARAAETRFANLDIWKFLRSNPSTLGEDFFKARITEAPSPKIKGFLDADEDIGIDEISRSRPLLLMVSLENTDVAMGKELKIQRRKWDPGINIFFRQHLEDKVILMEWGVIRSWLMRDGCPDMTRG